MLTSAFQLLLNPVKQTDDAEEGLNYIADLLVRYRLVEEAYGEEIEKNTKGYFVHSTIYHFQIWPHEKTNLSI